VDGLNEAALYDAWHRSGIGNRESGIETAGKREAGDGNTVSSRADSLGMTASAPASVVLA
jgi:hypothetical protein